MLILMCEVRISHGNSETLKKSPLTLKNQSGVTSYLESIDLLVILRTILAKIFSKVTINQFLSSANFENEERHCRLCMGRSPHPTINASH